MLAIKIWNYLRGYVIIKVEGLTLERLLNMAANHDIYLWDIKRVNNLVLEMKSSPKGFKELKNIVHKVGCRVEIKSKIGVPFLISRLKERKVLMAGLIFFWVAIFLLSSTIWKIEIFGNEQTPREEIISLLKENNISIGRIKFLLDKDRIKYILADKYDYLSFISVNIKGSKLAIEIKEQDLPPEKVDKSYPCDIVATQKGVILKITAKNGKAVVEKGSVVAEGDVLITGVLGSEERESPILVHADGEVLALTRYSSLVREEIIKNEEKYTGKVFKEKGIKIGSKGLTFIKGEIPFTNYKESIHEKSLFGLDKYEIDFPIKIIDYEYKEVELKEVKQNIDFLKNLTQIEATKEINSKLPDNAQIQSKNTRHQIDGNTLTTQVIIEAIENIGRKRIIGGKED